MKIQFLIYFIPLLVSAQAALTIFPNGPFEGYKAYIRGICAAANIDCDLSPMSSCWDDASASKGLNIVYESCLKVANASPNESSNVLRTFFVDDFDEHASPIADSLNCEKNTPYGHHLFAKLSAPRDDLDGMITNIIHYASVRPDDTFNILKNMAILAEKGNFEAMGLLDGNFMSRASAFMAKERSDWRKNAKNGRSLILKGMCESLALNCPIDSLNSMNQEDSATHLQLTYEWFKSVATQPITTGAKNGVEFFLGRVKELMNQIPKTTIERDKHSIEAKLISEKLGFDVWGAEWLK